MTQEMIQKLSDVELQQTITWAADEQKARAAKRKQETIAKIKALAAQAGVTVAIEGGRGRGRPSKSLTQKS